MTPRDHSPAGTPTPSNYKKLEFSGRLGVSEVNFCQVCDEKRFDDIGGNHNTNCQSHEWNSQQHGQLHRRNHNKHEPSHWHAKCLSCVFPICVWHKFSIRCLFRQGQARRRRLEVVGDDFTNSFFCRNYAQQLILDQLLTHGMWYFCSTCEVRFQRLVRLARLWTMLCHRPERTLQTPETT